MSMNFEIFPTKNVKLECTDLINNSLKKFKHFLETNEIHNDIFITIQEVADDGEIKANPKCLPIEENRHMVFSINGIGEIYVFYHSLTELDIEFWNDEVQINPNVQKIKDRIDTNLKLGYSWSVKRTMGQPAVVSLYYGYLAMMIAKLTDGILYSDDGAWDYALLPMESHDFEKEYLNIENVKDASIKENVSKWIAELKKGN